MKSILALSLFGLACAVPILNERAPTNHEMSTSAEAPKVEAKEEVKTGSAKVDDVTIVQYALTLENLENAFYREALKNFTEKDFLDAFPESPDLLKDVMSVAADEKAHVDFLTAALTSLKQNPAKECVYSFPVTDVKSMAAVANILEGVGVSAYLGAAGSIADKTILGQAASIATIESRHSSLLRKANKQAPLPSPFDTPMDFNPVFSLASAFIKSCPDSNPPLPFKAFPAMSVASDGPFTGGTDIAFDLGETKVDESKGCPMIAFFVPGAAPVFQPATKVEREGKNIVTCKAPSEASGQVYAVMTYDMSKADDTTIVAGPAIVECRPQKP